MDLQTTESAGTGALQTCINCSAALPSVSAPGPSASSTQTTVLRSTRSATRGSKSKNNTTSENLGKPVQSLRCTLCHEYLQNHTKERPINLKRQGKRQGKRVGRSRKQIQQDVCKEGGQKQADGNQENDEVENTSIVVATSSAENPEPEKGKEVAQVRPRIQVGEEILDNVELTEAQRCSETLQNTEASISAKSVAPEKDSGSENTMSHDAKDSGATEAPGAEASDTQVVVKKNSGTGGRRLQSKARKATMTTRSHAKSARPSAQNDTNSGESTDPESTPPLDDAKVSVQPSARPLDCPQASIEPSAPSLDRAQVFTPLPAQPSDGAQDCLQASTEPSADRIQVCTRHLTEPLDGAQASTEPSTPSLDVAQVSLQPSAQPLDCAQVSTQSSVPPSDCTQEFTKPLSPKLDGAQVSTQSSGSNLSPTPPNSEQVLHEKFAPPSLLPSATPESGVPVQVPVAKKVIEKPSPKNSSPPAKPKQIRPKSMKKAVAQIVTTNIPQSSATTQILTPVTPSPPRNNVQSVATAGTPSLIGNTTSLTWPSPGNGASNFPYQNGLTYPKPGYKQCIACAKWYEYSYFRQPYGPLGEWKTCSGCLRDQQAVLGQSPKTHWYIPLNWDNVYHNSLLHLARASRGVSWENGNFAIPRNGPYVSGFNEQPVSAEPHNQCIVCTKFFPKQAFWNDYGPPGEWKSCSECLERKWRCTETWDNYYHPSLWQKYLGKDYVQGVEKNAELEVYSDIEIEDEPETSRQMDTVTPGNNVKENGNRRSTSRAPRTPVSPLASKTIQKQQQKQSKHPTASPISIATTRSAADKRKAPVVTPGQQHQEETPTQAPSKRQKVSKKVKFATEANLIIYKEDEQMLKDGTPELDDVDPKALLDLHTALTELGVFNALSLSKTTGSNTEVAAAGPSDSTKIFLEEKSEANENATSEPTQCALQVLDVNSSTSLASNSDVNSSVISSPPRQKQEQQSKESVTVMDGIVEAANSEKPLPPPQTSQQVPASATTIIITRSKNQRLDQNPPQAAITETNTIPKAKTKANTTESPPKSILRRSTRGRVTLAGKKVDE